MGPKKFEAGPFRTSDPFMWDIVLNGELWRVSKSSVRGDTYIQGLDSNFLLHYYKPKKK